MTAQNPDALSVFYLGKTKFCAKLKHLGIYFGQKESTCKTEERRCKSLVVLLKQSMSLKLDGSMADDLGAFIWQSEFAVWR